MDYQKYRAQVRLLLQVLPVVSDEKVFALHGGTAINLFHYDMPRLSVDIDLTYLGVEDRETSLENIRQSLERIKNRIEKKYPEMVVEHKKRESKLMITTKNALVKVEVNQIKRGCFASPELVGLCEKAQEEFNSFSEIQVVEMGHLFGGKICAALDRQHPRDLFDVHNILKTEKLSEPIKKGFIFYLISSNRPFVEMLFPQYQDQYSVFEKQFKGMTEQGFTYEDYEANRYALVEDIHQSLTVDDKLFLISIEELNPDWTLYDFEKYPAVQWKLQNLEKLKKNNPEKHANGIRLLREKLL